jgi:ankyrin repeat protein
MPLTTINLHLGAQEGCTPLLGAVSDGQVETVTLLLDKGADIEACMEVLNTEYYLRSN